MTESINPMKLPCKIKMVEIKMPGEMKIRISHLFLFFNQIKPNTTRANNKNTSLNQMDKPQKKAAKCSLAIFEI